MDILTVLDGVLDNTPEYLHLCPPLPRRIVASTAAEIRRLRALLAVATSPGKTRPALTTVQTLCADDAPKPPPQPVADNSRG